MLRCLVEGLRDKPGVPISLDELTAAGWPRKRFSVEAAASHVYTTVWELRKLGLAPLLTRDNDGYLLDPGLPFRMSGA